MNPQQYGIKVAQVGYDVRTCKDYDLIFSSSWPSLAIVFDVSGPYTTNSSGNIVIPHNLGFPPLAMSWQFTDSTMASQTGRVFPNVDKNNIYFLQQFAPNTTVYLNNKCYNLDISIPQNYSYLQPPATNTPYDPTYGIKVVKQNQSITSTDMRSFILHSRCASPQVLSVVTDQTPYNSQTGIGNNGSNLIYTNPQGYTSWAFGYAQITDFTYGNIYEWAPPVAQAFPILLFNSNVVSLNITGGTGKGSIIILRDPLFAPNTVQVVY